MTEKHFEEQLQSIITTRVNPVLEKHYGRARLSGYEEGVVWVKMEGACGNCPAAQETIENVVKKELKEAFPSIIDVRLDDSVDDDMLEMACKILYKEKTQ